MFCRNCGKELPEGAVFCTGCGVNQTVPGASVPNADSAHTPAADAAAPEIPVPVYDKKGRILPDPLRAPAGLTRKEFFKNYSKARGNVISAAIIGYIAAGISLIFTLVSGNPFMLIDVAVLLVCSLLLHLLQSRVCAILLLAYSLYNTIFTLVVTGQFTGWLIIIAGVFAVIGAFTFWKEWKAYLTRTAA